MHCISFIKNKFEVSKIYMTACICLYKFCQIKEYFLMIFSCFIQKIEWYFYDSSWFFMFYSRSWMMFCYILLKKYSCFTMILMNFSRFFKIFHVLFKILNNFLLYFIHKVFMFYQWFWWFFQDFSWFSKVFFTIFFFTILLWFSNVFHHTINIASILHHI